MRKPVFGISNQVLHNPGCTATEDARGLKLRIKVEEVLHYTGSENKDTDQLRIYCAADLRLCFSISKTLVFS